MKFCIAILILMLGCNQNSLESDGMSIQLVSGAQMPDTNTIWLSHEHILVDFIGADSIQPNSWNRDTVINNMWPFLEDLNEFNVVYFVDATPNYLGRDVILLEKLVEYTGLEIMTNTGLYGARENKFIPSFAFEMKAEELADSWISEYEHGIEGTSIKPGFIKIGIDAKDTLDPMHRKLVKSAAITHSKTGLTIASHTGEAKGLWPQLEILKQEGVSPEAFIWVHAQNEIDNNQYVLAEEAGCWISLDGLGWEIEKHIEKLKFAKDNGILGKILISHDAGWYDPQKSEQNIQPFTNIFNHLIPALLEEGFTQDELDLLLQKNPSKAFLVHKRLISK